MYHGILAAILLARFLLRRASDEAAPQPPSRGGRLPNLTDQAVERRLRALDLEGARYSLSDRSEEGEDLLSTQVARADIAFIEVLLNGDPTDALKAHDVLRFSLALPDRYRLCANALISWLVVDRPDAARDVVEIDYPKVHRNIMLGEVRHRLSLAKDGFDAIAGAQEDACDRLEHRSRHGVCALHRWASAVFLSHAAKRRGDLELARYWLDQAHVINHQTCVPVLRIRLASPCT